MTKFVSLLCPPGDYFSTLLSLPTIPFFFLKSLRSLALCGLTSLVPENVLILAWTRRFLFLVVHIHPLFLQNRKRNSF